MIKKRGYRIELDEIEYALRSHPNITDLGVVAREVSVGDWKILVGILSSEENSHLNHIDLHNFCGTKMPSYMIPDRFVFLEDLPKTSTHKIDYQKLKELL